MKFPAYSSYKPSGVEWLGEIPAGWVSKRLSYLALLKSGENITSDELEDGGVYPVFGGNGIRGYSSRFTHSGNYVLIGRQGALCGNINYADGRFWASEHAIVASPLCKFPTSWLGELLRAMNLNQYSVSAAQPGLAVQMICGLKIPVPPLPDQVAIAAFVESQAGKIGHLMGRQQELIERLKEKRTALISRAVTRGLPPAASRSAGLPERPALKRSGLDWLGDIPTHWGLAELRRFTRFITSGSRGWAEYYSDEGSIFVRIGNLTRHSIVVDLSDVQYVDPPLSAEGQRTRIRLGDMLVSITAYLGSVAVASEPVLGAYINQHIALVRVDQTRLDPRFAAYSILGDVGRVQLTGLGYGGTKIQLSLDDVKSLRLCVPPLREQEAIALYLDEETAKLDRLVAKVEKAIERLQEYRTALITAAVTGKIDVRGAVA